VSPIPSCPDAETLAAFVEGKLKRQELAAVLLHLDRCPSCRDFVSAANEEVGEDAPGLARSASRLRWWAVAAAALIVALVAIPVFRNYRASSADRLVELAPRSVRVLEPRLSGGFAWAPYRGPVRSSQPNVDARRLQLTGVAGDLVERADREPSAGAQRDAGVALVLIDEPQQAVDRLRDATARAPNDARTWSDLAAAQYAVAAQLGRPSVYPEALSSADRALRIDGSLAEALFNRALILERLGLTRDARTAWQRYLEVDAASRWAEEARTRLSQLSESTGESQFKRQLPLLERAAVSGDSARVEELVTAYRQQARTYAEAEHLGIWGESGDARALTVARAIGDVLARTGNEQLLRDAVSSIDRASIDRATPRRLLAEAHALYRRGRIAYSRRQLADAESDLRRAAELFARASSPMALVARYFAASARYDRNEIVAAQDELERLLPEVGDGYAALGAQVRWQLALCHMQQDDWAAALPYVEDAEAAFRRLGERSNLGFVQTLVADTLMSLGRPDDAWTARIESFRIQSAEGRGDRLPVSLGGAARMELRAGRLESARALLHLEALADRDIGSDYLLTNALVREAVLAASLGDDDAAAAHAREAASVAERLDDPALRKRALVDAEFARGAVLLHRDPRAAEAALTHAIEGYEEGEKALFLPECHLLRGRAKRALHDLAGAKADLERGIVLVERHRLQLGGPIIGTGILDAGRALFRDAIALAAEGNDAAAVFAYAERSRAQIDGLAHLGGPVISAAELQQRLRGSGLAVLQVVALDGEVATVTVTADELLLTRHRIARHDLVKLVDEAAEPHSRSELYDVIVRPAEPALAHARNIVVVADPLFESVPFSALYDTAGRGYLVERAAVSMALSASSLQRWPAGAHPSTLIAVALPTGESAGSMALPGISRELADLRSFYPRPMAARATFADLAAGASRADVVHIAGHTRRERGAGEAALRVNQRDAVSWKNIAAMTFDGTIVLAACETLRRPASQQTFTLSLGGGFVAAGAGDVIGTLTEIRDEDAYELFRAIHRQLAAGTSAADAVRRAQLGAIASGQPAGWASIAVLTRRITTDEKGASWAR
jgi:CHAT domain-containing protein/tetratricopeptide (TPR) repeat protein